MKAHDVRNLRVCEVCSRLLHKRGLIAEMCEACALERAGGLDGFMATYPPSEWEKLTLGQIGAEGMRTLMARLEGGKA